MRKINTFQFIFEAIKKYEIIDFGYKTNGLIPYVTLKNNTIFHHLPTSMPVALGPNNEKVFNEKNFISNFFRGIVNVIYDIEFRNIQSQRKYKQHSMYEYRLGDVVVEVGAYLGYYAMHAAQKVGPSGHVLAIELVPQNYSILKMNLMTNFPNNTTAINMGVYNKKGNKEACIGPNQIASFREGVVSNYTSEFSNVMVEMDTMDNILRENNIDDVDLMIIQTNGNEIEVLEGMRNSIVKIKNIAIAVPYNREGTDHEAIIFDFLQPNGFFVKKMDVWIYGKNTNVNFEEDQKEMGKKKKKKRYKANVMSNLSSDDRKLKKLDKKVPTISACMIVKDEEEFLAPCLKSIKDYVDEIIIVDTGSKDRTVEISESFGAKVYHHPWENNFSKHRNQSIAYASGDWIFVIDADEEVVHWDDRLEPVLQNKDVDSVYVKVNNIFGGGAGEACHNSIRLFRKTKSIRYEGSVHNQLMGTNNSSASSVVIYHKGYCLDAEKEEQKYLRTTTLLKNEIEKDSDNPKLHHYLAVAYLGKQLYDKAFLECEKAIYFASNQNQEDDLYLWTYFVGAVSCMNTNRIDEAEKMCLEALQINPMHLDSYYLLSSIYYVQGNEQAFMDHSEKYLSLIKQLNHNPGKFGLMVHNTVKHEWRIHLHRGFTYASFGLNEKSRKEYSIALKKCHNKIEYYKQRCLIHLKRSENRLAEKFLKKALKYNSEDKELNEAEKRLMGIKETGGVGNKSGSMMSQGIKKTNAPTISLCMMVKNEEKFLSKCLDSVKDYVDEIVIVDTGSTDSTVDIARKFTDKIYFHPWEGHFSKHRNQSIKYATKDWIFILDADEMLLKECAQTVRESIQDESIDSVYVVVKNAFDRGSGEAVHNSIRIFRNNGKIHYEGRVHNRIVGTETSKIYPITILHEGYNLPPEESRKKFIRTSELLKKEIEENPQHPRAYHYLAASYLSGEMLEDAIDMAMKAIQLADENNYEDYIYLWSHFIASFSYLKTDRLDDAEQICLKAVHKCHNHLDSHYLLTIIYYTKKDLEKLFHHSKEYLSLFDRIKKTPGEFGPMVHNTVNHRWRVHLHRAFAFQEMDKKRKAEGEYGRALKHCGDKREYYKMLASFYNSRSEFSVAEEYLLESLKYNSNDKELYLLGARIYCELGMRKKEMDFLDEAIKRGVDDIKSLFRLGTIYLEEKSYNESSALLEKVIEMDENHLSARINLGIIARRSGELNKAVMHLEKALEVSPNSLEALSNLGYVYYDGRNFEKAKGIFEYLTYLHPTLLDVLLMLSMIYIRIGGIETVVAECDKILGLLEMDRNMTLNSILDLSNLFVNIGKILLEKEQAAIAILAFEVAYQLNDGSDVILKKIGDICLQKEHYRDSLKYLEKAIRLNPQDWESFFLMGSCYEKMGVKEGAAISYEKARALNPDKTSLKHSAAQQ